MQPKLILTASLLVLFCVASVYSGPKTTGDSTGTDLKDLAHRMVQVARDRYETGRFESADKILQASLEIDPGNAEACYYLALVQKAVEMNKNHHGAQPWYPTIPPGPAKK